MTTAEFIYDYEVSVCKPDGARYYFISEGERQIAKAVEYKYIGKKEDRLTYNLGFGTYNLENDELDDHDISDNGDHYKVLNTVLSTIPHFLNNYPGAMVMVEGSDSSRSYPEICRPNCKKKCIPPTCKNVHRRINIYKKYINKNFEQLAKKYTFWGTENDIKNQDFMEEYKVINNYSSVLFIKK